AVGPILIYADVVQVTEDGTYCNHVRGANLGNTKLILVSLNNKCANGVRVSGLNNAEVIEVSIDQDASRVGVPRLIDAAHTNPGHCGVAGEAAATIVGTSLCDDSDVAVAA